MNKKEMFKKVKALLLAGTIGTTFTGCSINVDDDLLEKLGISIVVDSDGNINIDSVDVQTTNTTVSTTTTTTLPVTETVYVPETSVTTTEYVTTDVINTSSTTVTTLETTSDTTSHEINEVSSEKTNKNLYTIESSYESKGEYLYSILMKLYGNLDELDNIKKLNNLTNNYVSSGSVLVLPSKTVYYNVYGSGNIIDVSNQTGISIDQLCKLNNFELSDSITFDKDTKLLVKSLSKDSNSYMTNNGMAQIYQGNIVFADELVTGNGITVSNNYLLGMRKISENENIVSVITFDGNGDYTESVVAYNASKIGLIENIPVVYVLPETIVYNENYYKYNDEYIISPIIENMNVDSCEKVSSRSK